MTDMHAWGVVFQATPEVLQHAQGQAEPTVCSSRALADTIMGMGMTLAVMAGRLIALLALRKASPPTQSLSQR